jgi:acetylornithine/succinyldiaminopimelate/putrescine aminotransferase
VEEQVSLKTCAILLEPIQGESGIIPAEKSFLKKVEKVCRDTNTLLMLDEIQCGLGRTGTFCAYEYYDVKPDIMTLAKPLAGGLPLGAILLSEKVAKYIKPGHHGSTFGGGPLVSKVATFVLEKLLDPDLLLNVNRMGLMIKNKLVDLQKKYPIIKEIRARGLMIGIALDTDIQTVIQSCQKQGLLVCKAGQNTIRFVPPLIITEEHVNQALDIFEQALENNHDQKS